MDTSEVRAVVEKLLTLRTKLYPAWRNDPSLDAGEGLLVKLASEPNTYALLIELGRALYELEEANESLRRFNAAAGHQGSFSVFAEAAREMNPAWHHRSTVQWNAQKRVDQLTEQFRDLARSKAIALYNQQHPESPRV